VNLDDNRSRNIIVGLPELSLDVSLKTGYSAMIDASRSGLVLLDDIRPFALITANFVDATLLVRASLDQPDQLAAASILSLRQTVYHWLADTNYRSRVREKAGSEAPLLALIAPESLSPSQKIEDLGEAFGVFAVALDGEPLGWFVREDSLAHGVLAPPKKRYKCLDGHITEDPPGRTCPKCGKRFVGRYP
jgi:hypothetical protein